MAVALLAAAAQVALMAGCLKRLNFRMRTGMIKVIWQTWLDPETTLVI